MQPKPSQTSGAAASETPSGESHALSNFVGELTPGESAATSGLARLLGFLAGPELSRQLDARRRVLFAIPGLFAAASLLEDASVGPSNGLDEVLPKLWIVVIATTAGLLGTKWVPIAVAAAIVVLTCFSALSSLVGYHGQDVLLGITSILLTWAAMFVGLRLNILLAAAGLFALWLGGAKPTLSVFAATGQLYSVPLAAIYVLTPLALTSVLIRDRSVSLARLDAVLAQLRQDRRELLQAYHEKTTELESTRAQQLAGERHRTIGAIASNLAHELNNILTPILGLSEMLANGVQADQSLRYGTSIHRAASQAARLSEGLLFYARLGSFTPVRTDFSAFFRQDLLPDIQNYVPTDVLLQTRIGGQVELLIDRRQVKECFRQLTRNAVDSMPEGGVLEIEISKVQVGGKPHASIRFRDNGRGIAPDELAHVFDPFAGNRRSGNAMGLGLAIVQGVVSRHNGQAQASHVHPRGCAYQLLFPLIDSALPLATSQVDADAGKFLASPREVASTHGVHNQRKNSRAWLVSSDDDLRDELEDQLDQLGFQVQVFVDLESCSNAMPARDLLPALVCLDAELSVARDHPLLAAIDGEKIRSVWLQSQRNQTDPPLAQMRRCKLPIDLDALAQLVQADGDGASSL